MKRRVILICCEGKKTEKQYFDIVVSHRLRSGSGPSVKIKTLGAQGQHKRLIDNCLRQREHFGKSMDIPTGEIEVWAVCDKDTMNCTLDELETYAEQRDVKVAFSDPRFEVFLLQHLKTSATKATGRQLDQLLSKAIGAKYDKTDITWVKNIIDKNPHILETVIRRCNKHPANQKRLIFRLKGY